MFEYLILAAIVGVAALVLTLRSRSALPAPLRGATLHLNERNLTLRAPIRLAGRPDQVWLSTDGELVVTDTKTRKSARIYPADTVQLSVYAYMLRKLEAAPVHPVAYARVPGTLGAKYIPVPLLSDGEVEELHARHEAALNGRVRPECNGSKPLCQHCGHKPRCPRWA